MEKMVEKSPRGPASAEKSPHGPASNGLNGTKKERFSQQNSPRRSITEGSQPSPRKPTMLNQACESFLQSAKQNMRRNSYTMAADDMNKAVQASADELSEDEKKNIQSGCTLLQDALAGRASHGLYSLRDEPEWKRILFKIQTHDNWQQVIILASMMHAFLIVWEAPNHRASWIDPTLDPVWVIIVEVICICLYAADVGMKMLYFGGWRDYVSKEWQRNYVTMIAAFSIDLALYSLRINPFRFSRPVRLFVIAGRHRDVRRLASFLPRMARKLVDAFAKPMLGSLIFFGPIFVRIYGKLPDDKKLNFGDDDFNNIFSSMRTLFMLATMDNLHPVVGEAFRVNPLSFSIFGAFIVVTGFFLMGVALGVIFDLYIEDHSKTVESEAKKEKKSVAKAFDKLDLNKNGYVVWLEFREMMVYLRPWDDKESHILRIFKALATEHEETGELIIKKDKFGDIGQYINVSFKKVDQGSRFMDPWWILFETWWVRFDAMIIIAGWDDLRMHVLIPNLSAFVEEVHVHTAGEINPWMDMRTVKWSRLVSWGEIQLGSLILALTFLALLCKAAGRWSIFKSMLEHDWRRQDYTVLLLCTIAHALHSVCIFPESSFGLLAGAPICQPPYLQLLDAAAAFRIIRAFWYHEGSRKYLKGTVQVGPVLMHIGGLSMAVLYFTSVTVMEMLAKKPGVLLTPEGFRLNLPCNHPLPNFDCASSAMLSSFELFVQENWGEVLHLAVPEEGEEHTMYYNVVSFYFIIAYIVLGICLCNLLTTLIVEFAKIIEESNRAEEQEELEKSKKEQKKLEKSKNASWDKARGATQAITAARRLGKDVSKQSALSHANNSEDQDLIMTGISTGGWRKRLKTGTEEKEKAEEKKEEKASSKEKKEEKASSKEKEEEEKEKAGEKKEKADSKEKEEKKDKADSKG